MITRSLIRCADSGGVSICEFGQFLSHSCLVDAMCTEIGAGRGVETEPDAKDVSILPRTRRAMERKKTGSVANVANAAKSITASVIYVVIRLVIIGSYLIRALTPGTGTVTLAKATNSSTARARKRIALNIKVRTMRE
jgi:hypothetical protein